MAPDLIEHIKITVSSIDCVLKNTEISLLQKGLLVPEQISN